MSTHAAGLDLLAFPFEILCTIVDFACDSQATHAEVLALAHTCFDMRQALRMRKKRNTDPPDCAVRIWQLSAAVTIDQIETVGLAGIWNKRVYTACVIFVIPALKRLVQEAPAENSLTAVSDLNRRVEKLAVWCAKSRTQLTAQVAELISPDALVRLALWVPDECKWPFVEHLYESGRCNEVSPAFQVALLHLKSDMCIPVSFLNSTRPILEVVETEIAHYMNGKVSTDTFLAEISPALRWTLVAASNKGNVLAHSTRRTNAHECLYKIIRVLHAQGPVPGLICMGQPDKLAYSTIFKLRYTVVGWDDTDISEIEWDNIPFEEFTGEFPEDLRSVINFVNFS